MKRSTLWVGIAVSALLYVMISASFAAQGTIVTVDENGAKASTFKMTDNVQIIAKVALPKPISKYKFDKLTFYIGFGEPLEWVKGDVPDKYLNSKTFTLKVLGQYGATDFPFNWIESIKNGQAQKSDRVEGKVEVVLYKKTGSRKETYWDKVSEKVVTDLIPIYDKGTVIAASAPFTFIHGFGGSNNTDSGSPK